jgi:hypothetical protein
VIEWAMLNIEKCCNIFWCSSWHYNFPPLEGQGWFIVLKNTGRVFWQGNHPVGCARKKTSKGGEFSMLFIRIFSKFNLLQLLP